jgi:hypothetical protein
MIWLAFTHVHCMSDVCHSKNLVNGEFLNSYVDLGTENLALDFMDRTNCQKVHLKIAMTFPKIDLRPKLVQKKTTNII